MKKLQQRPRSFWRETVKGYLSSGQSQRAFSEGREFTYHALSYWISKFRKEEPEILAKSKMLPVKIAGPDISHQPNLVEVSVPSGTRIRFEAGTDPAYVGLLAQHLERQC